MPYTPRPGELDTPIDIKKTVSGLSPNGYPEEQQIPVCHVFAKVADASSQYSRAADSDVSKAGITFTIRRNDAVKEGMVIPWDGQMQNIETIGHVGRQKEYMELFTKSVKGVK